MTADELRRTVIDALARIAPEVDPHTIRAEAPLRDQVDIDSMDFLHFVVALHQRLGVEIPESDYAQLSTIEAIVAYLSSRLRRDEPTPAGGDG
jgi:acyl carrier protein